MLTANCWVRLFYYWALTATSVRVIANYGSIYLLFVISEMHRQFWIVKILRNTRTVRSCVQIFINLLRYIVENIYILHPKCLHKNPNKQNIIRIYANHYCQQVIFYISGFVYKHSELIIYIFPKHYY